jgi:hypothetical protein
LLQTTPRRTGLKSICRGLQRQASAPQPACLAQFSRKWGKMPILRHVACSAGQGRNNQDRPINDCLSLELYTGLSVGNTERNTFRGIYNFAAECPVP